MDQDGNGVLTRDELIQGLTKVGMLFGSAINIDEIMNKLDTNGSGTIDFSGRFTSDSSNNQEFVVAAISQEKLLSKKRIEQAFKLFDSDGNGYIEKHELIDVMGNIEMDQEEWMELIEEYDTDNDGRVKLNFEIS